MRSPARSLTLALALCAAPLSARAQAAPPPARLLSQYALDHWDDRDGLPQNSVQALAQTPDGYLWLGTQSGLVRFDGVRFTTWGRDSRPALAKPYIWALAADPDGSVWIGTEQTGVTHFQHGRFTTWGEAQGLPASWVRALLKDSHGTLWIGTMGGGLALLRNGRVQRVDSTRVPGSSVNALLERDGAVWVGSNRGLTRVQGGRTQRWGAAQLGSPFVLSIAPARGGGLWVGMIDRVLRLRDGRVVASFDSAAGLRGPARRLAEDGAGALWIAGNTGVARLSNGRIEAMPASLLPRGGVDALLADREGFLWIGMQGLGLHRLADSPIVPFGIPEGLASDGVFPVLQARDGAVWVGNAEAGLARIGGGRITRYQRANGKLATDFVFSLAEDREGAMWVGTPGGVTRLLGGQATHYAGPSSGLPYPALVRAVLPDRQGRVWLGTTLGLVRFRPGTPRTFTTRDGLPDDFITTLYQDADDAIWVGTRHGLSRLADGRLTSWTARNGFPDADVSALLRASDGALWVATSAGLARLQGGRVKTFTSADGLCDDELHWLLEDGRGRLWLSANRGVFSLRLTDLNAYAAGRGPAHLSCSLYGRTEGMRSRETNGAVNPAGWKLADGRMVFPTMGGLAFFDPDRLGSELPAPPVHIEEVVADGVQLPAREAELRPGTRELEIHFTALSFHTPEKIEFHYRLEGLSDEWTSAGDRRTAWFTRLPPGRYRFVVAARHPGGRWSAEQATLSFRVLPQLYQTRWFQALAALALVAVLALLYRLRIRALKARERRLLAVVAERSRAEARYRDLFDNATDAVFTTDLAGNFTALNRKAEELTGYARSEAVGMNLRVLLPDPERAEAVAREWLAGTGDATRMGEMVARDGTRIPVEVNTRVVEEGGAPAGIQAVVRDTRERAELERQLREAQKMEAVGQLAGGVAHDFNNLLTIIKGGSELVLADLPRDDALREDVEMVLAAADRASGLTRQLLAFSRRQVVQPRQVDVNALVTGLEPMLRRLIGEDIRVTSSTCGEPALVTADPGSLEQVLVNLAVNARDAMPGGGTLTIRTSILPDCSAGDAPLGTAAGPCVLLSLSDTGVGMDAATQARIFEPFFTTKDPGKGTGLGLSTVYGIVRQAGGSIQCSSRPGRGTTFQVRLPYTGAGAAAEGAPADDAPALAGSETILLVEDEVAVRSMATRILRRHGYTVLETQGGEEALRVAQAHSGTIHLLLTDVVMPQMSGRELAERLLPLRRGLRVLYMSGYTDDEIIRRGLFEPGVRYLQKPFSVEGLAQAVRELLDENDSGWHDDAPRGMTAGSLG